MPAAHGEISAASRTTCFWRSGFLRGQATRTPHITKFDQSIRFMQDIYLHVGAIVFEDKWVASGVLAYHGANSMKACDASGESLPRMRSTSPNELSVCTTNDTSAKEDEMRDDLSNYTAKRFGQQFGLACRSALVACSLTLWHCRTRQSPGHAGGGGRQRHGLGRSLVATSRHGHPQEGRQRL